MIGVIVPTPWGLKCRFALDSLSPCEELGPFTLEVIGVCFGELVSVFGVFLPSFSLVLPDVYSTTHYQGYLGLLGISKMGLLHFHTHAHTYKNLNMNTHTHTQARTCTHIHNVHKNRK